MNESVNETEWAADRKVGFAMGILLVGVVAALFFRNEPLDVADVPTVDREEELNARLRDRNVSVYSDGETVSNKSPGTDDRWTRRELLEEFASREETPLPIGHVAPPQPFVVPDTESPVADSRNPAPPPAVGTPLSNPPPEAVAADNEREEKAFTEYTIQFGDTLSGLADEYLGSPNRYRDIYEANRDRIKSPDRLRVGSAIRIPGF